MTRGDRVHADYSVRDWPDCVVYPHGRVATVLEVFGNMAIIEVVGRPGENQTVNVRYLRKVEA